MRIEALLADLEAQQLAATRAERQAEISESVRAERARVTTQQRLFAARGETVTIVAAGVEIRGRLVEVGDGWVALNARASAPAIDVADVMRPGARIVSCAAIESVTGPLARYQALPQSMAGLGWGSLLRAVARGRASVAWQTLSGTTHAGVIDAVGRDHVLLMRSGGEPVLLPTAQVAFLAPMAGQHH